MRRVYFYVAPSIPISTEARGRARMFRHHVEADSAELERALAALGRLPAALAFKGATGRQRALKALRQRLEPHAQLVHAEGNGAMWRLLQYGPSLLKASSHLDPGLLQDAVAATFLVIGRVEGQAHTQSGIWGLAVADHAIGRFYQRSPHLECRRRSMRRIRICCGSISAHSRLR
jgi:hypothetical protein